MKYESLTEILLEHNQEYGSIIDRSTSTDTVFCRSLVSEGYLTEEQMCHAAQCYHLGRSEDGAVVFWEIDEEKQIRDGKLMYYHDNCHRIKERNASWVSAVLKTRMGLPVELQPKRCLFGLHLMKEERRIGEHSSGMSERQTVAVVEAEKTAVILSELYPDTLWMASGGLTMLNASKLYPLREHRIVLFPDTDETGQTYKQWKSVAEAAQEFFKYPIRVSPILESHATPEQKTAKIDLIDYLFK